MATIIQEDAPHPDSYRPDLPLRSEHGRKLKAAEALANEFERGNLEGFEEGLEQGEKEAKKRYLPEIAQANTRVAELTERLSTIGAREK